MSDKALKPGWPRVRFGDVVQLSKARSSDPLADGYDRYVGLEHIEPEDLRIRRWGNVADGVTFTSIFKPGQVLFGKRRAYQRKVAVADFSGVCSGDIYVLESKDPKALLPNLLPVICQTEAFFQHAVGTSAGSLSPRTNWSSLSDFEFNLPTLEEQQKLLGLLNNSLNCMHAIEDVGRRSQELRASLISFHLGKNARTVGMVIPWGTIPKNWDYLPVGDLTISSAYGPRFSANLYSVNGEVKTVRTTDFIGVDELSLSGAPSAQLEQKTIVEHILQNGDFLLSRSGEYAGKTRVFMQTETGAFIAAAFLIRYRLNHQRIRPKYLHYLCSSPIGQVILSSLVQGSAQPNIAGSAFSKLKIPVPPIEQQDMLIRLIEDVSAAYKSASERLTSARNVHKAMFLTV